MKLTTEQINKIDEIEMIVANHFGIEPQSIINRESKENVSNARYFLWYILHFDLGMLLLWVLCDGVSTKD